MRVGMLEVEKKLPYFECGNCYAHITVQETVYGHTIFQPKHFFYLQNKERGLGLPEFTKEYTYNLWEGHESGEIFEVVGEEAYSWRYMMVYNRIMELEEADRKKGAERCMI